MTTRRGFLRGIAAAAMLAVTPLPGSAVREYAERNRLLSAHEIQREAMRVLHCHGSLRGDVIRVQRWPRATA